MSVRKFFIVSTLWFLLLGTIIRSLIIYVDNNEYMSTVVKDNIDINYYYFSRNARYTADVFDFYYWYYSQKYADDYSICIDTYYNYFYYCPTDIDLTCQKKNKCV